MRHMSNKLDIGLYFTSNTFGHVREIAKKTAISVQTTAVTLVEMEKDGILVMRQSGRQKIYSVREGLIARDFLLLVEQYKAFTSLQNQELLHLRRLIRADAYIVYGSFARGDFTSKSDIDVVILNGTISNVETFSREISYEETTYARFAKQKHNPLFREIQKNHIIYGNVAKVLEVFA